MLPAGRGSLWRLRIGHSGPNSQGPQRQSADRHNRGQPRPDTHTNLLITGPESETPARTCRTATWNPRTWTFACGWRRLGVSC